MIGQVCNKLMPIRARICGTRSDQLKHHLKIKPTLKSSMNLTFEKEEEPKLPVKRAPYYVCLQ
jgi:hypothetical protein